MTRSSFQALVVLLCLSAGVAIRTARTEQKSGPRDLAFVHVPMNFGNSISDAAAMGINSTWTYAQVTGAGRQGWGRIREMAQPDATIWGPMNPDLQETGAHGCPLYYTPQKDWPEDKAESYLGNKTVFGVLRDPFDRWMAFYRASQSGGNIARGWDFQPDGRTCDVSKFTKMTLSHPGMWPQKLKCQLQPQAPFFEGPHGITLPIDLKEFPANANKILEEHGYDNVKLIPENLMHVTGCDNTWTGDLDAEARSLIKEYYKQDFELLCKTFGYCDDTENTCIKQCPGMCPPKAFQWNARAQAYSNL